MNGIKNQKDKLPIARNTFLAVLMAIAGIAFTLTLDRPSYGAAQGLEKLNRFLQKTGSGDPVLKQLREGRDYIEEGEWEQAADSFKEFINDHPKHKDTDQALYWLAYSQAKMEKYSDSAKNIELLLRDFPKSTWANEAKSLRAELAPKVGKQATPADVTNAGDEEIKIIALQSLCQGSSDRCIDTIGEILKPGSKFSKRFR